jgi:hypothetical protein
MLRLVLSVAGDADVRMSIGGGLAVNAHGFRRETDDVDAFFHFADRRKVLRSLNRLAPDHTVEQLDPSHWIAVPPGCGIGERIDLMFATGDPEESAIEMSMQKRYHGTEAPVFPCDMLVICKFLADRDEAKDVLDILTLHRNGAFDIPEITLRLRQMGLEDDAVRFPEFMRELDELIKRKRR